MSSEQTFLLRFNAPGTKELKTTAVDVFGSAQEFTSRLTSGYTRKFIAAYNQSNTASGEIVWGSSNLTEANGIPIPKGSIVDIPLSTDVPVYFCNTVSGEIGNLRVVEIA
jgi:hypothetical protein